jgi:GNAT superfamily N-acetyltransferase
VSAHRLGPARKPPSGVAADNVAGVLRRVTAKAIRLRRHAEVTTDISIRRGTEGDAEACHELLWASVTDFGARYGTPLRGTAAEWWRSAEPLHRHLAVNAAEWWVAEEPGSSKLVGYARSIERAGLLELTEFFVRPDHQSAGVGRTLIERAFPADRGDARSIIATRDVRALARYYRAGTVARFPIFTLGGVPARVDPEPALTAERLHADAAAARRALRDVELSVFGFPRDEAEVRWLLSDREGYLYRRNHKIAGFAFVGRNGSGPIAALDPADLPPILLHVEDRAHEAGIERLDLEVPAPNEVAIRHLLGRGFRFDPWVNFLMSNRPFGKFDRLICFSPPMFL